MTKKSLQHIFSAGLVLTAAIWGFAFVVVKESLDYMGPALMIAMRFSIATVCLSLIFFKKFALCTKKSILKGAVLGFFLFAAYFVQTLGCKYTTAGKNAFLTAVYVILIPLFLWPLEKKRPNFFVFLAALMAFTGIGLLALGTGDNLWAINKGDALTLLCGVFYALHIIGVSKFNEKEDPLLLTIIQFAFCSLFAWISAPFADGPIALAQIARAKVIVPILYLGIFSTMVCFVLQNVGLKYVPSALASLILSLESVFGVLFGILLLGEAFTIKTAVGCLLIFLAIILAQEKSP